MEITVKLFAFLTKHLPPTARRNQAPLIITKGTTVSDAITRLAVPFEHCHLVLVDGVHIPPDERSRTLLTDGQVLAIWPMVAGG